MSITRREVSKLIAFAAVAPSMMNGGIPSAAAVLGSHPRVLLTSFNYSDVRLLDGVLKRQFQETRDTYYNIPNDSLLVGFRMRAGLRAPGKSLDGWYGNDVFNAFGQYLGGMARMAKATDDGPLREKTGFLMQEWGKTIASDGYFFYSKKPNAYHYFYEKMMGGLNDIYEYSGDKDALIYIDRITDWAINNLDRTRKDPTSTDRIGGGGIGSNEWYTLSENLYRAFLNTGDPKYRKFAKVWHYDRYWNSYADGRPEVEERFLHAYSHVNTLSSAAMAYQVSGESTYLKTIVNAYDYLQRTQCFATGGYGPGEKLLPSDGSLGVSLESLDNTFETPCGTWAGFKLSRYLMGFTGDARYGDWIERLTYNGIGASLPMMGNGDTFYYSDYRLCGSVKVFNKNHWPCCSGTYPEAVADYHNIIYFKDPEGLYVNLFVPSEVTWRHDDQDIVLRQETSYPESGSVVFRITAQKHTEFPLHFRVPEWAKQGVAVKINDTVKDLQVQSGKWATIKRTWKSGDKVELQLPLELALVPVDKQHPKRVAITRGPLVLVRQGQQSLPADLSQWKMGDRAPLTFRTTGRTENEFVPFQRIKRDHPYLMYFELET